MKEIFVNIKKEFDHRHRLGIMSILLVNEWVPYKTLKDMLELHDGTLASHMKTLEGSKYVEVRKEFVGRKPQTSYAVTKLGRIAFNEHLDALEKLINRRE